VPCIHENALLRVGDLDNGRADSAQGLAGGESHVFAPERVETCIRGAAVPRLRPYSWDLSCRPSGIRRALRSNVVLLVPRERLPARARVLNASERPARLRGVVSGRGGWQLPPSIHAEGEKLIRPERLRSDAMGRGEDEPA
jgi:hypothetical protein